MIGQFIDDMIHMTEGEKLVVYWPLWLLIIAIAGTACWLLRVRR